MRLLLDTQIVQWLALKPEFLSRGEQRILNDTRNDYVVSAVSIWEMRLKWQSSYRSGQPKGEADPQNIIELLSHSRLAYQRLPLTFEHCTAVLATGLDHNDPFDRLLLAQAQVEGLRLLTRDAKFDGHPLAIIAA